MNEWMGRKNKDKEAKEEEEEEDVPNGPSPDAFAIGLDLIQHPMHLLHHIHPIQLNLLLSPSPGGHVQSSAPFGMVDLVAAGHCLDLLFELRPLGQLDEKGAGLDCFWVGGWVGGWLCIKE